MLKLFKYFLWLVVIATLIIGFDRLLVLVPLKAPGLNETQTFYTDFRSRFFNLFVDNQRKQQDKIKRVIEKSAVLEPQAPEKSSRYLYVDENGALQFADNLQQVPFKYRHNAQPLAE